MRPRDYCSHHAHVGQRVYTRPEGRSNLRAVVGVVASAVVDVASVAAAVIAAGAIVLWCREPALTCAILSLFLLTCVQAMRKCYRFSTGLTDAGKRFDKFVATLIMLNVIAVIAESEPSLGDSAGPSGQTLQKVFDSFEVRRRTLFCSGNPKNEAIAGK